MTYATDNTDSGRCQRVQEDCALDLRLDGFEHGYIGKLAQSDAYDYWVGYLEGLVRGVRDDEAKAKRFEEFRQREEAIHRGEPDWVTELMQDDEPTLIYDEF